MTVYVHIGTMKTGTTTLQSFLYHNRARLLSHGYLYPLSIKARSHEFHSHNPLAQEHPGAFALALLDEVRAAGAPHLIISSENLQRELTTAGQLHELRDCLEQLGCGSVRIIIYLRDVQELFVSLCTQTLKAGDAGDYACLRPAESHPWMRIVPDHRATLLRWGEVFGMDRLIVRRYARSCLHAGDLLQDFMQVIGCPWEDDLTIPADCNPRLNLLEMELLRRINALTPGSVHAGHTLKQQLHDLMHRHLGSPDPALRFEPPREITAAYAEYFRDSEAWVGRHFFPHEREEPAAPRPPEHYELRELRGCDWDRLAELLLEAARSHPPAAEGSPAAQPESEPGALRFHYRHPLLSLLLRLLLRSRQRRQFMHAPQACLEAGHPLLRLAGRLAARQD